MAPPLVCISFAQEHPHAGLLRWDECHDVVKGWLAVEHLVGHNVQYDMCVLGAQFPDLVPDIFRAYEEDRVTDTMWRQKLIDIASGCYRGRLVDGGKLIPLQYDLASLSKRLRGVVLDKDHDLRTGYGALRDVPIADWPEAARVYPVQDAVATLECFLAQEKHAEYLDDQYRQARAYFALQLMSVWGVRTNKDLVAKLRAATQDEVAAVMARLVEDGLVRPNGTRDTKVAQARMEKICQAAGRAVPTTAGGKPSLAGEACEASEDPVLLDYAKYTELNKVLSTDIPQMDAGIDLPIHCHYDLAATGRTTCSKPNLQNLRRLPGIREAYVPRPGYVFIDCDYNALELWCLAQVQLYLFGHSELANVLNSGKDPHTALAADILGITYEDAVVRKKDPHDKEFQTARSSQGAKGANFGFPGGLGPVKFVRFARAGGGALPAHSDPAMDTYFDKDLGHNVYLPGYRKAYDLREAWFRRWPEMRAYFEHVNLLLEQDTMESPVSHRWRGQPMFCAACNTLFQGMGADIAKHAGWLLAKACYVDRSSPLFGSRPVVFIHDQFIIETPEGPGMDAAAQETRKLMRQAAAVFAPQCVPEAEPVLCRYWSKDAVVCKDENGKLVPWPNE
jgi:DNA polymerase family A